MPIQTFKEGLDTAKSEFVTRLVAALIERTDLSQKQIGECFGVSESFVRKTAKRFSVPQRKRGPKPRRDAAISRSGDEL